MNLLKRWHRPVHQRGRFYRKVKNISIWRQKWMKMLISRQCHLSSMPSPHPSTSTYDCSIYSLKPFHLSFNFPPHVLILWMYRLSMIDAIGLLPELGSSVKSFLEVSTDLRRDWCLLMFRESPRLSFLEGRHCFVKLLICAYKSCLWFHIDIGMLRIDLNKREYTLGSFWWSLRVFLKKKSV